MALREYSGNAKETTLDGAVTAAATSLTVSDGTGYPTGAAGPFVLTVEIGQAAEEKILCTSRTGNTITVSARGWDDTTASDHANGVRVAHTFSATDAREANAHVNAAPGGAHSIATTITPSTAPSSIPLGVSTAFWTSGLTGAPNVTSTFTVMTVAHNSTSMFQQAVERDATPEGDERIYFRTGYAGGTPEWSAWRIVTTA